MSNLHLGELQHLGRMMNRSFKNSLDRISNQAAASAPQLVSAAFPFVPAQLSLIHFASTYLPADLLHRTFSFLGGRSALICATDVHSIQVSRDGRTRAGADAICKKFHSSYQSAFNAFSIQFNAYIRTDVDNHVAKTQSALLLLENSGFLLEASVPQLRCQSCKASPPKRLAQIKTRQLVCPWCGATELEWEASTHLMIDLESVRDTIVGGVHISGHMRNWVNSILSQPLAPWCATRDNEVGLPLHRDIPGKSLYLWFESLVGYATMMDHLATAGFAAKNVRLRHVIGKNIVYHHAILWPVIARCGLQIVNPLEVVVRGFALDSCEWADHQFDDPALRMFVLTKAPDSGADFRLQEQEFKVFSNKIWSNKIENFFERLSKIAKPPSGVVKLNSQWCNETIRTLDLLKNAVDQGATREITETILAYLRYCGKFAVQTGLFWSQDKHDHEAAFVVGQFAVNMLALTSPQVVKDGEAFYGFYGSKNISQLVHNINM
ncbi:class I tRNA ligase family protein [Lentilitoribacter sp. EG35]|uniref:class I tRNA ligase family protein n=1 Tax=Lentilitoribacter sp. EG35 TaxID=3234192 RepID=UPI0034603AE0